MKTLMTDGRLPNKFIHSRAGILDDLYLMKPFGTGDIN
jgi:hypothetical protein